MHIASNATFYRGFNTQPPEGGWDFRGGGQRRFPVSTHSRLKAAGKFFDLAVEQYDSFNTQPPEGGWASNRALNGFMTNVSTHSRLKAAGTIKNHSLALLVVSTHSRLKAAGSVYLSSRQT